MEASRGPQDPATAARHTLLRCSWRKAMWWPGHGSTLAPMQRLLMSVVLGALVLGGCAQREAAETGDDLQRFVHHGSREYEQARHDVQRFVISNSLTAANLPLDAARFVEWRKREWWALQDELAWNMSYEWVQVEKLSQDVARYYGYNIANFPKARADILRFFERADPEWRSLVQDVTIFVEYQNRELMPLRRILRAGQVGSRQSAGRRDAVPVLA